MATPVPPGTSSIPVCDYCGRVQTAHRQWLALHPAQVPAEHLLIPEICPDCCARYVAILLAPEIDCEGSELPLPPFRHR
jgi:hypothetical protein